jgi:hypothetical protein
VPSGHTDLATINDRRPLTPRMVELMGTVRRYEKKAEMHGVASNLFRGEMTTAEKNAARALVDRGLLTYTPLDTVIQTEAGKALPL